MLISFERDIAHEIFMKNYSKIFEKKVSFKSISGPVSTNINNKKVLPAIKNQDEEIPKEDYLSSSHDIKVHLDKIRIFNINVDLEEDLNVKKLESIKKLRRILKK